MNNTLSLFAEHESIQTSHPLKKYSDRLTADVNQKGVLDVDTVKGCTAGMNAIPGHGCYSSCYAAKIAKFRGIDFTVAVARRVQSVADARQIEEAVRSAPEGFFRVGTMGDPSHEWEHTVVTIEWLAKFAVPVIVTKHWMTASTNQLSRLVACGAVLNTSISALDTPAQLAHRRSQIERYRDLGGVSVSRVVSCEFNTEHELGKAMAEIQERLFQLQPVIDNPLRVPKSHWLVQQGIIKVEPVLDLSKTPVSMSLLNKDSYVGHCSACQDKCGLSSRKEGHPSLKDPQLKLPI